MSTENKETRDTFFTAKDGTSLFYRQDFPAEMKATVVIVHGVNEHCGRYQYITECLNKAGYGVMRFDLRGHGKSGGERGYTGSLFDFSDDVRIFTEMTKKAAPSVPVYMLGHSMGSFISAMYAIRFPGQIEGQVLSGIPAIVLPLPTLRLLKFLPYDTFPMIRVAAGLDDKVSRDPAVAEDYVADPLNLKKSTIKMAAEMFLKGPAWMAQHVKEYTLPCLLLHGGGDLIVTPASSEWFFNNISSTDKQRIVYPVLYHEIFNEKERDLPISDAISWLDKKTGR